ncbi:MAG TPA: hypothetical protein VJ728_13275, partial [Candidatus Binataceae bacterium]|nr:hypothetical protein [Candidatus Binataceae bacterium]
AFLISAPYVHAQASLPENGARPITRTSSGGSRPMGMGEGSDAAQRGVVPTSICSSADGAANRAMDGFTLRDFATATLAGLSACELSVLETQIGVGREAEATGISRQSIASRLLP